EFVYDESGNRIKKIENGVVSYYISEDFDVEDGEGIVYYFTNGDRIAKRSAEGRFWYLDDHLGSTNVMMDSNGKLVERTLYYPFGSHREGGEEKYSFTGKEFDSEIGIYYYGARYYNPETFVFTQADSLIPDIYNPQALNRYSYCYNNPLKYEDPDGHVPVLLITATIGAVGGALLYGGYTAYTQYAETGQINWKDVGKDALIGGISGGLIGLTCGAGSALAGSGTAAALIIDTHVGAGVAMTSGVAERAINEKYDGGDTMEIVEAGFNGDAMLMNMATGSIPASSIISGQTIISDVFIDTGYSKISGEATKSMSAVNIIRDGGEKVKNLLSPVQTTLKDTGANFKNYVNSKTSIWKQKLNNFKNR
ncbi:MAG: RHS repeat-associated core domain-containing protein, partial [Methanosarcinales archaeon]|nr:RHS repeat-associated core domain-containing protein [Methanosarcinales archaeon]